MTHRPFLIQFCFAAAVAVLVGSGLKAAAQSHVMREDSPNTHNMLVFGEKKIYASHLPMFDSVNEDKTEFTAPHRYQVILDVSFLKGAQNLQSVYTEDRHKNANAKFYTLNPETFVLPRLGLGSPQSPLLSGFKAKVFRGHLERGGQAVRGLDGVEVKVNRIVHFRKFNPHASELPHLKYLLFGSAHELFLAHYVTKPPDFDQILSVTLDGHSFTDAELGSGIEVTIPERPNQAGERMKETQQLTGNLETGNSNKPLKVSLKADKEIYFEEGELLMPPTFEDTKLEKKEVKSAPGKSSDARRQQRLSQG
jgi:hypothetical protein